MSDKFSILSTAQLNVDFINTNAYTHTFIFSALAELVDNARDANADNLKIYAVDDPKLRGGYSLCFLDDGDGMDPSEVRETMILGLSRKKHVNDNLIGRFGNGLKSSTMRVAYDFILFTKKNSISTVLLLSRTFYEKEKIENLPFYAAPSFNDDKTPWYGINDKNKAQEKHNLEVEIILKYSPFHTKEELFKQFDKIESKGTLVIIYNVFLNGDGTPNLIIDRVNRDIIASKLEEENSDDAALTDIYNLKESKSFRKYVSILYSNPRMKIYIENSKVKTKMLEYCLYKPRRYTWTTLSAFRKKIETEIKNAENAVLKSQQDLREVSSNEAEQRSNMATNALIKQEKASLGSILNKKIKIQEELRKNKSNLVKLKEKKSKIQAIDIIFGINLQNRRQSGFFIYNQNRLIMMYVNVLSAKARNDPDYQGIVGIINIPYSLMDPSKCKQKFRDDEEYQRLKRPLAEYLTHYVEEMKAELRVDSMSEFWKEYGYFDDDSHLPSYENKYVRKRFFKIPILLQCDLCLKWRLKSAETADIDRVFPDNWCCEHLIAYNCGIEEHLSQIDKGKELVKNQRMVNETPVLSPKPVEMINVKTKPFAQDEPIKVKFSNILIKPSYSFASNTTQMASSTETSNSSSSIRITKSSTDSNNLNEAKKRKKSSDDELDEIFGEDNLKQSKKNKNLSNQKSSTNSNRTSEKHVSNIVEPVSIRNSNAANTTQNERNDKMMSQEEIIKLPSIKPYIQRDLSSVPLNNTEDVVWALDSICSSLIHILNGVSSGDPIRFDNCKVDFLLAFDIKKYFDDRSRRDKQKH